MRLVALLMPQQPELGEMKAYLVSVYEGEAATGLDFLSLLDDGIEKQLESVKAGRLL